MGVGSTLESLVLLYNKRGRASDLWRSGVVFFCILGM